ncbi:WGR domain-containing protein [Roseiconus lacunae]|uniref:WGR domain-containing protein n=1 Tax=Roseiconus lacunae TaxID=2605694 RepID=UPI001E4C4D3F|nr:WGR domain-containing protein [Roseiconus lacunae]MCD0460006.1 WGR domain-containing protein [Roseiconus lacunae]
MSTFPIPASGRLTNIEKNSFWDWSLDGKSLTTVSGKLGRDGRKTTKKHPSEEKAASDLESKHFKKLREGFRHLHAENPGPIALQTFFAAHYTGFMSFDLQSERNELAACRSTQADPASCEIVVLDPESGSETKLVSLDVSDVSCLRWHDHRIVFQADDRVSVLDIESQKIDNFGKGGVFPHFEFDLQAGRLLSSRSGTSGPIIAVDELLTGQTLLEIDASEQERVTDHHIQHVGALAPSGKLVAICRQKGEIEIYNLDDGTNTIIRGDFPCVSKLQFHPSGEWIGLTEHYGDWRFRVWSLSDGREDSRFRELQFRFSNGIPRPTSSCFDFSFSPSGKLLALRDNGWIQIRDFHNQKELYRIEQNHVVRDTGTSGFRIHYAADGRLVTRTDRGVLTVYPPHSI